MNGIPFGAIVLTDFPFTDLTTANRRPQATDVTRRDGFGTACPRSRAASIQAVMASRIFETASSGVFPIAHILQRHPFFERRGRSGILAAFALLRLVGDSLKVCFEADRGKILLRKFRLEDLQPKPSDQEPSPVRHEASRSPETQVGRRTPFSEPISIRS